MGNILLKNKELLAFVHIEKAAGTTLIHILRINFFMRYCDVKPFTKRSKGVFTTCDLNKVKMLNPFVRCISGHTVKPFSDLKINIPQIKYITLLRDPVKRYISHYNYCVDTQGYTGSFHDFLKLDDECNFQTKKIAGSDDLDLAKKILTNDFFMVGVVEEFDEFLILLQNKLKPYKFYPYYKRQNVNSKKHIPLEILNSDIALRDMITKQNQLDIKLYDYVKNYLLPKEKASYGASLYDDVIDFKKSNKGYNRNFFRYLDYAFRKYYYEMIFGIIRKRNGLPPYGPY